MSAMGRKLTLAIQWKQWVESGRFGSYGSFMTWSSLRVAEMLARERTLLEEIFGNETYKIEDTDPDEATVRSATYVLRFGYDRNQAGDVMAYLSAEGSAAEPRHSLETWARFLGEDWPPLPVDRSGKATLSPEQQVHDNLITAARLVRNIFSDPQKGRDAYFFAEGYLQGYNDWASRKGLWKHS